MRLVQNNVAEIQNLLYDTLVFTGIAARVVEVTVQMVPEDAGSQSRQVEWSYDSDMKVCCAGRRVCMPGGHFCCRF